MFFFFQAEDGIRDYKVTGVQTCALPISGQYHGRMDCSMTVTRLLIRPWYWPGRSRQAELGRFSFRCDNWETGHGGRLAQMQRGTRTHGQSATSGRAGGLE